ncbi:Vacuolar protein sorting-associated protein 11 [Ceratocystis pirilliformis]|uniref:Vacuolar protein sorting-associated protein 11 n=1 Tax=Ceratocystis pirilliformis TaxID=259994 RepID=A0ABR3YGN5_9PEZI
MLPAAIKTASSIRPIPSTAVAQIRSSAQLTSLNEVIVGLIQNALDAKASRIRITLDYSLGNCTVEDNGNGILPTEFDSSGGLGKAHHTSKLELQNCHGNKGVFLMSLASLSLVKITSRCKGLASQNSLTLHKAQVICRNTPSSPAERSLDSPHGTRVNVGDLFGFMPVRVRQRATADSERQWASLIWNIAALLICWPAAVSITVTHTQSVSNLAVFSTKQKKIHFRPVADRILAVRTPRLLSQANLAHNAKWEPVSASVRGVTVKGCIAHSPSPSKKAQLISIGVVPLLNSAGTDPLYEQINRVFSDSAFAQGNIDNDDVRFSSKVNSGKRPRKSFEKWPMFYFQIHLLEKEISVDRLALTPSLLTTLGDLLTAVCKEFLKKTNIITSDSKSSSSSTLRQQPLPKLSTKHSSVISHPSLPRTRSVFDSWSRMKVGQAQHPKIQANAFPKLPLVNSSGNLTRPPFEIELPAKRPKKSMTELVSQWKNPVFEIGDRGIPRLAATPSASPHNCASQGDDVSFATASMAVKSQISKDALARAHVLNQVDQKFILISVPQDKGGSLLVIVDQHAADERARLEELMTSYFPSSSPTAPAYSEVMETPLTFEVPTQEGDLLIRFQTHFCNWGVSYTCTPVSPLMQVIVSSLPPSIHARCIQDPALLITLLRAEIWSLAESYTCTSNGLGPPRASAGPHGFVARFRTCPTGILDLLNSRACRSAVMFNDPLSHDECKALLERLSRCAFPFQCAHGRPAMVPLVDFSTKHGLWEGNTEQHEYKAIVPWRKYAEG